MTEFERIAPRLYKAHRERQFELQELARAELVYARDRSRLERLIAHRELQLQRAQWTRNGRYIVERRRKLRQVREAMVRLEKRHNKVRK